MKTYMDNRGRYEKASVKTKPKFITDQDKIELAEKFGIEYRILCTVLKVESAGSGFSKDGRIKIQFEPYHFRKYTGVRIANGVENQKKEYKAYFDAVDIDENSAMLSTSWGLGQIMGFNHKTAGYKTVQEMVQIFIQGEYYQLEGMLNFIKSHKKMFVALISKEWAVFAYYYNGKYYKKWNYDIKLKTAYGQMA